MSSGCELGQHDRVGDAAADVLVDRQAELVHQGGLADEDQVVVLGEVLEEQPQLAQAVRRPSGGRRR